MERKDDRIGGFEEFLSKLGAVPKDKIKFYLHWIRRFLKFRLQNIIIRQRNP